MFRAKGKHYIICAVRLQFLFLANFFWIAALHLPLRVTRRASSMLYLEAEEIRCSPSENQFHRAR